MLRIKEFEGILVYHTSDIGSEILGGGVRISVGGPSVGNAYEFDDKACCCIGTLLAVGLFETLSLIKDSSLKKENVGNFTFAPAPDRVSCSRFFKHFLYLSFSLVHWL